MACDWAVRIEVYRRSRAFKAETAGKAPVCVAYLSCLLVSVSRSLRGFGRTRRTALSARLEAASGAPEISSRFVDFLLKDNRLDLAKVVISDVLTRAPALIGLLTELADIQLGQAK